MVGKVFTGGVQPGTQQTADQAIDKVQRQGTIAPVPTEQTPPTTEASTPFLDSLAEQGLIKPTAPAAPDPVEPASLTPEEQQQRERERVEPLMDRTSVRDVPFNPNIDDQVIEDNPYLGAVARADRLQSVFDAASEGPTISALLTGTNAEGTKRIDALNEGDTEAAFRDLEITASRVLNDPAILDATTQDPQTGYRHVDPSFVRIMGLATEQFMTDSGSVDGVDFEETIEGTDEVVDTKLDTHAGVKKAKGNARLGQTIWQEWQREKNLQAGQPTDTYIDSQPPSTQQSEFIGAMAKEAYALANPQVVNRVQAGNQVEFQFKNPEVIRQAQDSAKHAFGGQEVPPTVRPSETAQLEFEGRTYTRPEVTKIAKQDAGKMKTLEEARHNYHKMAKVIDERRLNLLVSMAIPALKAMSAPAGQRQPSPWADMMGVGKDRYEAIQGEKNRLQTLAQSYAQQASEATDFSAKQRFQAKSKIYQDQAIAYDVEAVYSADLAKAVQTLNTLAKYKGQSNYLTYSAQMLTGRLHVQQTRLNPGADKLARFVIGHGDRTSIDPKKNGPAERNFKEVATIHLGLGGKLLQPHKRVEVFNEAMRNGDLSRYAEMGRDLQQAFQKNDDAVAALAGMDLSQGIQVPAAVGQVQPLAINQATLDFLAEHKTEAPYIAEFLMDFADFFDGKAIQTPLEVEMDGITHGISTNGIALGIQSMAERAGAIQIDKDRKLVASDLTQGDIRQAMADFMNTNGYSIAEDQGKADLSLAYNEILGEAIKDRENYLKKSPMTLAYGQEVQNLRQHVEAAVFTGPGAKRIREISNDKGIGLDEAVDYLHEVLTQSLHHALHPRVLEMGQLLRANNSIAMITNDVMTITSPAGFDQFIGAKDTNGDPTKFPLSFKDEQGKTRDVPVYSYPQEASGSALRAKTDPVTGETSFTPGGWGRGRVIPAAVQGYDGNMIAKTGSGQSLKRIQGIAKGRSGQTGNFQPIFDAFKVSIGMMDVLREESNKNWINGLKEKNYFHSIDDWSRNSYREFEKKLKDLPPDARIDLNGEYRGLGWLMNHKNLGRHLASTLENEATARYDLNPETSRGGDPLPHHFAVANAVSKELQQAGIVEFGKPVPDTISPQQAVHAARIILKHLDLNKRNGKMRSDIDRDSKKMFDKINRQDNTILQVDLG